MTSPHPSAADLTDVLKRYDAEAVQSEFDTGRYRLRYMHWGDGQPVVFVHGLCDQPRSFALLMSELVAKNYRVIAYDLANGMDDGAKLGKYTHADHVSDLIALLDRLQLDNVDIKGSSFGSTITLQALLSHPQRFRRVVLQGGFAYRKIGAFERGLCQLGRYLPGRMSGMPARKAVMGKLELPHFVGCPEEIYEFLISCSGDTPLRAAARRGYLLSELDLRPELKQIPHPTLMIGGDRDTIVPRESERTVEDGLPNVKRIEFSPCGHYPQYTMPVAMAEAMHEHLKA